MDNLTTQGLNHVTAVMNYLVGDMQEKPAFYLYTPQKKPSLNLRTSAADTLPALVL